MNARDAVFVTGAAGFVGSRLVARLREHGRPTHALIRDGARAPGLERIGARAFRGDVTLPDSLKPAVAGCEAVVHCAVGGSDLEQARAVNVRGTENVLRAAIAAGARRVVHVSSVVAHGRAWPPVLTEAKPLELTGDPYAQTKAEAEQAAERLAREGGIELVIVRPTIVYGPGSGRILAELSRVTLERIKMLDAGRGWLNMIYVDDLVDGIILALDSPAAAGEAFLMSGDPAPSWHEYLTCLATMCGKPAPPPIPVWRARMEATVARWHFRFTRHPRRIEDTDFSLMHQPSVVSVEKARRILGFHPATTLQEGMRRTEQWLRETGWLPSARAA